MIPGKLERTMSLFAFMTCHVTLTVHKHNPRWRRVRRVKVFLAFLYKVYWDF